MSSKTALFRTEDLGSGFRVHLHRTKAFKTVTARLVFQANLDDRTAARALVPRILARGTERLPALRDVQIELDRLFGAGLSGDTRKAGERQLVQFRADWITDKLAGAPLLDAMGDLLREYVHAPARAADGSLRTGLIEQERKMMADEAAAVFDDKGRYARHRLLEIMCRDEAYARPSIGRLAEIQAVTPAAVENAYADLVERAPADLFLVGDLTWAQAKSFGKKLGLHRGRRPRRLKRTARRAAGRPHTVTERQEVGQAKLAMGFRTSVTLESPLYPGLIIMNALFGGLPTGKLFKVVREQASLCYSIHSMTERAKGLVLVAAGIDADNYTKARRMTLAQLAALQAGKIEDAELAMAKGTLLSSLFSLRDAPHGVIDFALDRAIHGIPADLESLLAQLEAVTVKDVARAARTVELDTVFLLRK